MIASLDLSHDAPLNPWIDRSRVGSGTDRFRVVTDWSAAMAREEVPES